MKRAICHKVNLMQYLSFNIKTNQVEVQWHYYLEISINDKSSMHMFEAQNNFCRIKSYFALGEDAMLRQMIVQITTIHQVQNKTQFLGRLKCVSHTYYERTTILQRAINRNIFIVGSFKSHIGICC